MHPATAAGERGRRHRLALSQIASLSSSSTPRWRSGSADSARCNARFVRALGRPAKQMDHRQARETKEKKKMLKQNKQRAD